ncbi:hypothetical protein GCM10022399_37530 [Terrabacter ginsenosidimutans]|uniref:Uncharacterized protein n=1 Tax=Terrabacter ginsenosidimutans TaxID=490575 RepID=A0ABP7ECV3_9MICO
MLVPAMIKEGLRNFASGADPAALKRGTVKAVTAVNDRHPEANSGFGTSGVKSCARSRDDDAVRGAQGLMPRRR